MYNKELNSAILHFYKFSYETHFHKKGFKIASFWKCEFLESGNGLFASCKGNQSGFRNPEVFAWVIWISALWNPQKSSKNPESY